MFERHFRVHVDVDRLVVAPKCFARPLSLDVDREEIRNCCIAYAIRVVRESV